MRGRPVRDSHAVIQAHQEPVLVVRGRFIAWLTIAGFLLAWLVTASHLFRSVGAPVPLFSSLELCIVLLAVTQIHRLFSRQHVIGLSTPIYSGLPAKAVILGCSDKR